MSITTKQLPAVLAATASLVAFPAVASAHDGPGRAGAKAPSRVTDRATRAVKAIDRASDAIDDGNAAAATAALKAARTNLASALKSAQKHVVAGDTAGPASADVVLRAEDRVAGGAADLFDGVDGANVDDLAATLKAADDGRDALVASIGALADHASYSRALAGASGDVAGALSDLGDALSDDTLTDAAKAALGAAQTQDTATKAAIDALTGGASGGDADYLGGASGGGHGGCPQGGGGRGQGPQPGGGGQGGQGAGYLS
jgi:trimeric autotransporter adhesin